MTRRIEILNDLTAMIVEANDGLPEKHDVAPVSGRVQILSIAQSEIRRYWRNRLGKTP